MEVLCRSWRGGYLGRWTLWFHPDFWEILGWTLGLCALPPL